MSEPQLTGLAKTFNSSTFTGRANVAKATYAGKIFYYNIVIIYVIFSAVLFTVLAVKAKNALKG